MKPPDKINEENYPESATANPLAVLPLEVLVQILFYLDVNDLNNLSQVDKSLLDIISQDDFWKKLLTTDFPEVYKEIYVNTSAKNTTPAKQHYITAYKKLTSVFPSLPIKTKSKAVKALILINRGDTLNLQQIVNGILKNELGNFLDFYNPFFYYPFIDVKTTERLNYKTSPNLFNTAIKRGNLEIINVLIKHFASQDCEYLSLAVDALKQAAVMDRLDIIDALLAVNKSLININDKNFTPFTFVCLKEHYATAIALVERGAQLYLFDRPRYATALIKLTIADPNQKNHCEDLAIKHLNVEDLDSALLADLIRNNFLRTLCELINKGLKLDKFPDLITTAIDNNNAAFVLLFLYHKVDPKTALPTEFFRLYDMVAQFTHFNSIWIDHGNITGPEDQRNLETRRLEKVTAILNDWLSCTGSGFFKSKQQQLKATVEEKIKSWCALQCISPVHPSSDQLIKDLDTMIEQAEDIDIKFAWRLRFIKGKLELQNYNVAEITIASAHESESSLQLTP